MEPLGRRGAGVLASLLLCYMCPLRVACAHAQLDFAEHGPILCPFRWSGPLRGLARMLCAYCLLRQWILLWAPWQPGTVQKCQ